MEEIIVWIGGIIIALIAAYYAIIYVLTALYTVLAVCCYAAISVLDVLFSAGVTRGHPEMMWAFWGMIIGMSLAFWTIAPVYGMRSYRWIISTAPFFAMVAVAIRNQIKI